MENTQERVIRDCIESGSFKVYEEIQLTANETRPFLGDRIFLSWRASETLAGVDILHDGRQIVSAQDSSGQLPILLNDLKPHKFRAVCGGAVSEVVVQAMLEIPEVQVFQVPSKIFVGSEESFNYDIRFARKIIFEIVNSDDSSIATVLNPAESASQVQVPCLPPGEYVLRLIALSRHHAVAREATVVQEKVFEVAYKQASINQLIVSKSKVYLSDKNVILRWQTSDASKVILTIGGETSQVQASGDLKLDAPKQPDVQHVTLCAENQQGEKVTKHVSVTWQRAPFNILLTTDKKQVVYGGTHTVKWTVEGAKNVKVWCESGSHRLKISDDYQGKKVIRIYDDIRYVVEAKRHDGQLNKREILVHLDLLGEPM